MIIVLCGVAGSGKDTIADLLVATHNFKKESFAKPMKEMVKLAYPDFTDADLYGPSENRSRQYKDYPLSSCPWCGGGLNWSEITTSFYCASNPDHSNIPEFLTPRIALQTLGTQWGRRLYVDTWVDSTFSRMRDEADRVMRTWVKGMLTADGREVTSEILLTEPGVNYVITDGRFHNEVLRSNTHGAITVRLNRGLDKSVGSHQSEAEFQTIPGKDFCLTFNNAGYSLEELPAKVELLYTAATCYRRTR